MPKLSQKIINRQIGKGRFKQPEKCCGGISTIQSIITRSIPNPNESHPLLCWVFEYAMGNPADIMEEVSLDDLGGSTIPIVVNLPIDADPYPIYEALVNGFISNGLNIQAANVITTDLGGGLFSIQIYFYGVVYTNFIGQAGGAVTAFVETECDADYIQDSDSNNILDSLGLPLIST